MVIEEDDGTPKFLVPHHYEANVKAASSGGAGAQSAGRARRLAQEAVTLSTSLPLSYSSSVFVRCDEDRLDVMKVRMVLSGNLFSFLFPYIGWSYPWVNG